jgi:hypothetical protein
VLAFTTVPVDPRSERGQDPPVELGVAAERQRLRHDRGGQEGRSGVAQARRVAGQPA